MREWTRGRAVSSAGNESSGTLDGQRFSLAATTISHFRFSVSRFPPRHRRLCGASGRVGDQSEIADALVVGGRELVDEGALPDRFWVAGELELVNVARME